MQHKSLYLSELSSYLDAYLDPTKIDEGAYNGVQVTNRGPITKIATAVTASREVIEKTIACGAQVLIAHHGLFCKKDPHPLVGIRYECIKLLIDNNIALLGYHLPLDAHHEVGNNWRAARDLGLQNLRPFAEYGKVMIGVIGTIESTPFDEFKKRVDHYYGRSLGAVRAKDTVATVAILSGAAEKYIVDAARGGADCFITGRVDEPVWDVAREQKISFFGMGHYTSEVVGPQALAEHVQEKLGIPCEFIKTDNPF